MVCPRNIKVKPIWIMSLEVTQERLAVPCVFHDPAHCVPLEKCVEFGDSSVQGLGARPASKLIFQLLGGHTIVTLDKSIELLCTEGSVLHSRICVPTVDKGENKSSCVCCVCISCMK